MKAIAILNWVMFYGINIGMIANAVPLGYGIPLMIVALFFAISSTQAAKSLENTLAIAQVYASGVRPQDFENGKTKAPAA